MKHDLCMFVLLHITDFEKNEAKCFLDFDFNQSELRIRYQLTRANFASLEDLNRIFPSYKNLVCFGDVPRGYDAFEQGDIGNGRARNPKQCEQMCSRMFKGCNAFSFDGHFCWFKKLESYTLRIV